MSKGNRENNIIHKQNRIEMKFNFMKNKAQALTNYEGARAYTMTPEEELYAAVVTASLSDNFYEKAGDRVARISKLISNTDPAFVAKLAIYARTQMNMRSVPLVLAVELAKLQSGNSIVSKTVSGVVKRADEITELLAYYQAANQRRAAKKLNRLSKQMQKGLAQSFNTFDEYQFAKYNKATEVKLRDALFLVHPKAKDEAQQQLFNKIAADTLDTPYTWETEISAVGQVAYRTPEQRAAAVRAKWEELIDSNRMGYMATLRNLRNILQAGVSGEHVRKVCAYLADAKAVAASKQLPFRFLSAYRELYTVSKDRRSYLRFLSGKKQMLGISSAHALMMLEALEKAVRASAANIQGFGKNTAVLIACDVSGSMQKPISARSSVQLYDIGLILAMLLQSRCDNAVTGMFGEKWKVINMPAKNILANAQEYHKREGEVGYATNGHLVIDHLIKKDLRMDKVMLFTDCQLWDSANGGATLQTSWRAYKRIYPAAQLYLFDLAGHGTTPVNIQADDVHLIAGWSDKIFDVLQAIEDGSSAVEKVRGIEL